MFYKCRCRVRGGGIYIDGGTAMITHSTIAHNGSVFSGGGLIIVGGELTITASTITANGGDGGGGIRNGNPDCSPPCQDTGTVLIAGSAITQNTSTVFGAGGIVNSGTMEIINTTIAQNQHTQAFCSPFGGRRTHGIENGGTLLLLNSTVADNTDRSQCSRGLVDNGGSATLLQNTIVARNTGSGGRDCEGPILSLDHNLIGDPTGCTITLLSRDLTGDPGFGPFTDTGRPGNGHFPLLPTSQAIDAGNDAICPRTDQLGRRRVGPCDIGAIEFRERDDRQHDAEDDEHDAKDEEDEEDVG
jgi:hypothetical protein